ncbi:hypothetical protein BN6_26560 [Saccharothrix espanaensis DSM 44229]|uniref:Uncharacterized protein n=1 Tax=Saccharothrix espanaensis (strain ATCC 51144 / DSM 44229 / JCM 9112 / NBRC 15066 / NRRL 15764) TaxID=1179773 RepID=K0JZ66_SACES|nr:hypothetical protein BN6_26560 [Saccharothrix espanaensis DSM 44229]
MVPHGSSGVSGDGLGQVPPTGCTRCAGIRPEQRTRRWRRWRTGWSSSRRGPVRRLYEGPVVEVF